MESSRQTRKIVLGLFPLIILGIFIYILSHKSPSQLTLTAAENKFTAHFQISKYDQNSAESFLQEVGLAKNILDDFQFSLDGTSSARLAYISPLITDLKFQKEKLEFAGTSTAFLSNDSFNTNQTFKAPSEFSVALFASNLSPLIEKRITLPPDFKKWLDTNLKSTSGQYLFLSGEKPDFALIFKKDSQPDFEKLKSAKVDYKEEMQDNITFHLINIKHEDKEETYVVFEIGDLIFVTSSLESAKDLATNQKGTSLKQNVFGKDPLALAVMIQNSPEQKADSALNFVLGDKQKITNYMDKIKSTRFFLKDNTFHGEVELLP